LLSFSVKLTVSAWARRVADELKLDDRVAADAIRDVTTGREYSFLVNAYKPRFYYWEGALCAAAIARCW
jgi:hypothetical protein